MPSLTRCVCKNNLFIHFVYGDQNQMRQSGWVYAIAVLFQQPHMPSLNALRLQKQSIHSLRL